MLVHIAPTLERPLEEAGDGKQKQNRIKAMREGKVWSPCPWTKISADTGVGNPYKSTPEKGKAFLDAVIAYLADFLVDFAQADTANLYE